MIGLVDKHRHALVARTMRVDSSPGLSRTLHLNAVLPCPNRVLGISSLHYEVWMAIEVPVFD